MRTLAMVDYMNMPSQKLLGFWIMDQACKMSTPADPITLAERYEKIVASYEAYGREGVSMILGECGYMTEDDSIQVVHLSAVKGILTKMKNEKDHRIFFVEFVKRTDGSVRKMMARFGVTKALKGGEKAFADEDHDLKTVWDTQAAPNYTVAEKGMIAEGKMEPRGPGAYRSIALENIVRLSVGGRKYVVAENKDLIDALGKD